MTTTSSITSSSSGRHRNQEPSRGHAEPTRPLVGDPSGPTPPGHHDAVPPLLRIVRGEPSAEEIAALTAVVVALSRRRARRRPAPVGGWADFSSRHRRPLRTGPGGWQATGRAS